MSYPQMYVKPRPTPLSLGSALLLAGGVAIGGAVVIGTFFGITNYQSGYLAVLLGWAVGMVICRAGGETHVAATAATVSLAGSAAASVIGVTIGVVRIVHVPFSAVLGHMSRVISLVPHVIGWFGFLCWALSAAVGWATVRSRGRRYSAARQLGYPGAMSFTSMGNPGIFGADDPTTPDDPAPGDSR